MKLDADYWQNRYQTDQTGWDLGEVSPPLKAYLDQLQNKDLHILIPGCGRGYEALYLAEQGFKNVTVADIAPEPLQQFNEQSKGKNIKTLQTDFFDIFGTFDLILEQTFFCALPPELRRKYVQKSTDLLNVNGKIAGVLFDFPLTKEGPPFGGNRVEYEDLFSPDFYIKILDNCYNSVKPRLGSELFFIFEKRKTSIYINK